MYVETFNKALYYYKKCKNFSLTIFFKNVLSNILRYKVYPTTSKKLQCVAIQIKFYGFP